MQKLAIILGVVLIVLAAAFFLIPAPSERETKIKLADTFVRVELADTPELRARGLSGRSGLDENEGMLFVFDADGRYGFWMKDMLFSIDILWIDSSGKIVHIEQNVSPESYPASFQPPVVARYVLELQAQWTARRGVRVGDAVELDALLQ